MEHRFHVGRRTRDDAEDMIMALALYGNHHHESEWGSYLHTTRRVVEFLAAGGYTLGELIEECRDKDSQVPLLENLISTSGWTIMGATGVEMSYTDAEGNEVQKMPEAGTFSMVTDAALFEKAVDDFERAIAKMSYTEYLSALANGLASIEAHIAQKAYQYNVRNPDDELLDDKDHKVAFEDKIKVWVPKMAGAKLNLGDRHWADFQRLKRVRDTEHTHTKSPALYIPYRELCELLNLFRSGIAGMLLNSHALFGDTVPAVVVKYAFYPDIKLVAEEEDAS